MTAARGPELVPGDLAFMAYCRAFASRAGADRKGALVRTILVTPGYYVDHVLPEISRPLISLGIGSGGKGGGEVRLKVWLSLLMRFTAKSEWMRFREFSPVVMAHMLNLEDPKGNGADRVRSAYRWLISNNYIEIKDGRLKQTGEIRVLDEAAQFLQSEERRMMRRSVPEGKGESLYPEFPRYSGAYVRMPLALWSNGWIAYLRASELLVLLFICRESENGAKQTVQFKAEERQSKYGLSEAMWRQGLKGLEKRGLIHSSVPDRYETDPSNLYRFGYFIEVKLKGKSIEEALSVVPDHARNTKITLELTGQ